MIVAKLGWEAPGMNNDGTNDDCAVEVAIVIKAIQLSLSMGFAKAGTAGFAEVLVTGMITTGPPVYTPDAHQYVTGPFPANNDFGPTANSNPAPGPIGTVTPSGGGLFNLILKANAPAPVGVNETIYFGAGLDVPAGSYLVCHFDHLGAGPADCEMQGCLHYEK